MMAKKLPCLQKMGLCHNGQEARVSVGDGICHDGQEAAVSVKDGTLS